jgi:hypothetical protein
MPTARKIGNPRRLSHPLLVLSFVLSLGACMYPDEKLMHAPGEEQADYKGTDPLDWEVRNWDPEDGAFGTRVFELP